MLSVDGLVDGLVSNEYNEDVNMSYASGSRYYDRSTSTDIGQRRQALIAYLGIQGLPDRKEEIIEIAEQQKLPLTLYTSRMNVPIETA